MKDDPFKEYLVESEPTKRERGYSWYTAIGLQKVDGLETSSYLNKVAEENIEGNISIEKAEELIKTYYIENKDHSAKTEEADKVSVNIAMILSEKSFVFSPAQYIDIHKKLFGNVFKNAGKVRNYNISKKEWVLDGDTVIYGGTSLLRETIEYDFNQEKSFDYKKLDKNEFIAHISRFIANIWQIHLFSEGNTRTTAIFLIKYLRKFGFNVTNDVFAKNAWYFRNALVRANYTNVENGVYETTEYLEMFLKNLIFNETNELKNRHLHINWNENIDIDDKNIDIQKNKLDIGTLKLTKPMKDKINKLYHKLSGEDYFGRSDVLKVVNLSPTGASNLISRLLELGIITPVENHGKGKYCFNIEEINHE